VTRLGSGAGSVGSPTSTERRVGRHRFPARFFAELKRRHVFRVAVAYSVAAWIVVEVSSAVFPALHVPDWALSGITVLFIVGLPVALVLAWLFDITPYGVERTEPLGGRRESDELPLGPGSPLPRGARTVPCDPGTPDGNSLPPVPSVAALPFVDLSADGSFRYLADGITEELIHGLARLRGLRVVARTSAFAFRDSAMGAREIGERLGVRFLVEGGVRVAADRLRLTVQLVSAQEGYTLWSGSYDHGIQDLILVQEEVGRALVAALRPHLGGEGAPPEDVLAVPTSDVDAYTLYLRGRARWNERTEPALREAIRCFGEAVALDPRFAQAHAGIADTWAILTDYGLVAPGEGLPPARAAAERAVQLGPDLAEAQTARGLVRQLEGFWGEGEAALRQALELSPGYVPARHRLALLEAWTGRRKLARETLAGALALDPLSPPLRTSAGWLEYYDRRYGEAVRLLTDVVGEHPGYDAARIPLVLARAQMMETPEPGWTGSSAGEGRDGDGGGREEEAPPGVEDPLAALERQADGGDVPGSTLAVLVYVLGCSGRRVDAARWFEVLRERASRRYVSPYYLALAELGSGRPDRALIELRRGAEEGAPQLIYLAAEPAFDPLRGRAAFQSILQALGNGGPSRS
jgi:adenylate cyclase